MVSQERIKEINRKANKKYTEKNNLTTIACKVNKEYKELVYKHCLNKGYNSINAYILDLIAKDME